MNEFLSAIFSFRKSVIWQLLAELSGVVSSIIFIIIVASFLINIVRERPLFLAIILVLFVLAIIFLLKRFKSSIKKAAIELEGKRTQQEISSKEIVGKKFNLDKTLPSTKQLRRWNNFANKKALEWASDVLEQSFTLYITVGEYKQTRPALELQIYFVSDWKNEVLTMYLDSRGTPSHQFARKENYLSRTSTPFFLLFKNWQWAVRQAYEKVKSKLDGGFRMIVFSHSDQMSTSIEYKHGKVTCRDEFSFDGKVISSSDGFKKECK